MIRTRICAFAAVAAVMIAVSACRTKPEALHHHDAILLSTKETKARFDAGQTIFIDARRSDEFGLGHVAGALNLPAEEFVSRYTGLAPLLPRDAAIIVYCDDADAGAARLLAERLAGAGYGRVKIFRDGWHAWKAAGWPGER